MADLQLHNTLTGKKGTFVPMKAGEVSMYVCGITPYDESHLGHARCYVVFDVLRRVLEHAGYKVKHIQNFTDVDDKIIERANQLKKPAVGFAEPYMASFKDYMARLNVKQPDKYPLVTENIPEIIAVIEKLEKKGLAYNLSGNVYYAVRKFPSYGKLSKRKIDELEQGARVEVDEKKKDPLDFALWKAAKLGEPAWDSPWGKGRPGWHIECSAMSMKFLGEEFDIHGGGLDLIFPHHENEIAQSVGATDKSFAKTWVHNGFVTVNKEKMSKSLGNFFTLKDIFAKYDPMVVRYFLLSQHYRSPLNFSDQELEVAKRTWIERICGAFEIASQSNGKTGKLPEAFEKALFDDLNTAEALGILNTVCSELFKKQNLTEKSGQLIAMLDVLGLKPAQEEKWAPELVDLARQREEARKNKDWKKSDELRDALKKKGVLVEDTSAGPKLKRI